MKWCEANRPARIKKGRATCDRLVALIGDKELDAVGPLDVERFKRARVAGATGEESVAKVAPATVNRDLEVLSHFLGRAVSWGLVPKDVVDAVPEVEHIEEPPRTRRGDSSVRFRCACDASSSSRS